MMIAPGSEVIVTYHELGRFSTNDCLMITGLTMKVGTSTVSGTETHDGAGTPITFELGSVTITSDGTHDGMLV
jgi:hypothetical protein